jgi:chemotaxis protein MotB
VLRGKKLKKKHHHEEEAGEAWLLPYSDLMTLLLALFIALFAISQVDQDKASEVALKFRGYMTEDKTGDKEGDGLEPPEGVGLDPALFENVSESLEIASSDGNIMDLERIELEKLQEHLRSYAAEEGLSNLIGTHIDERGLVVSLSETALFDTGEAVILPENQDTLIRIGEMIKELPNYIRIEGHTDPRPISNSYYRSNWDLSNARAASVVMIFEEFAGIEEYKMSCVGFGDSRPLAENYKEDGSYNEDGMAQNRRVDLVILSSKYDVLEETSAPANPEIEEIVENENNG